MPLEALGRLLQSRCRCGQRTLDGKYRADRSVSVGSDPIDDADEKRQAGIAAIHDRVVERHQRVLLVAYHPMQLGDLSDQLVQFIRGS